MARMTLVPQKREFFDLYNRAAENTVAISRQVIELLDSFPDRSDAIASRVKELEHEGDRITHEIVDYGVRDIRDAAKEQARVIEKSAMKLTEAIARLEGFKDSRRQLIELRDLEDEGDAIARHAIAELFTSIGGDALAVIRWKDIHEQLEDAVDACENAADVLEAIVVKNR